MRSYNVNIDTPMGKHPYHRIQITWGGVYVRSYTDRKVINNKPGVLTVGTISQSLGQDNSANFGSCSISLDDTDGDIKNLFNIRLLEGSRARIYLCFTEGGNDMLLMKGKVSSLQWREGTRTVDFNIETDASSQTVGYSLTEENQIENQDPLALDKVWPLCFGTPMHVPAVRVKRRLRGSLATRTRLASDIYKSEDNKIKTDVTVKCVTKKITEAAGIFTSEDIDNIIYVDGGHNFPQGSSVKIIVEDCLFEGTFNGDEFTVTKANGPKYENIQLGIRPASSDPDRLKYNVAYLPTNYTPITLINHYVKIQMGAGSVAWNIVERQEGRKLYLRYEWQSNWGKKVFLDSTAIILEARAVQENGVMMDMQQTVKDVNAAAVADIVAGNHKAISLADLLERIKGVQDSFWTKDTGTPVQLWGTSEDDKDVYVINSVHSTLVRGVYAERTYTDPETQDKKISFVPVPSNYYTVNLNDNIADIDCTTITFDLPLDSFGSQSWSDTLYCTVQSSVGPSFMDIATWIVENFTDSTLDKSQAVSAGAWDKFPMDFALTNSQDAIQLLIDLAWQARCGVIVGSEAIRLIYISRFISNSVMTINTSKILEKTLEESITRITDIRTILSGNWTESLYSQAIPRKTSFRRNDTRFGQQLYSKAMYAYNVQNPVLKTVRFWAERYGNAWKYFNVTVDLCGTKLEVWDQVTIQTGMSVPESITGFVYGWTYDPSRKIVSLNLWTPYTVGDTATYPYAFFTDTGDTIPINPSSYIKQIDYDIQLPKKPRSFEDVRRDMNDIQRQHKWQVVVTSTQTGNTVTGNLLPQTGNINHYNTAAPTGEIVVTPKQPTAPIKPGQTINVTKTENGTWLLEEPATVYGIISSVEAISALGVDNANRISTVCYTITATNILGEPIGGTFKAVEITGCVTVPANGAVQRFTSESFKTAAGIEVAPIWCFTALDRSCPVKVAANSPEAITATLATYQVQRMRWNGTTWEVYGPFINVNNVSEFGWNNTIISGEVAGDTWVPPNARSMRNAGAPGAMASTMMYYAAGLAAPKILIQLYNPLNGACVT